VHLADVAESRTPLSKTLLAESEVDDLAVEVFGVAGAEPRDNDATVGLLLELGDRDAKGNVSVPCLYGVVVDVSQKPSVLRKPVDQCRPIREDLHA
jgi:hypothetical protein